MNRLHVNGVAGPLRERGEDTSPRGLPQPPRRRNGGWPSLAALLWLLAGSVSIAMGAGTGTTLTESDFNLPPQDEYGWSILTPSVDSRLVYVDAESGSDSTGQFHAPGDPEIGPDPLRPQGQVRAFRTLAAAEAMLRQNAPDWLLLRAGRVWYESLPVRRGRSPTERMVVAAWGDGPRPELRTGAERGIATSAPVNLAVVGIRFWAHTRDTDGPFFTGYAGRSGISFATQTAGSQNQVRDTLIEDCVFRSYASNEVNGKRPNEPVVRLAIRRSIFSGNYKSSGQGHSQGLYHGGEGNLTDVPTVLLQENLFDHNGWRIQSENGDNNPEGGQATFFNHNTYFSSVSNVLFQRNIFLRASSMGTKWTAAPGEGERTTSVVIDNNLYAEGELGIGIGGNDPGADRFDDVSIRNNVFTDIGRTRPTNRSLSWGIEAIDWGHGSIVGNLFIHQRAAINNTYAIDVSAPTGIDTVLIEHNVIANMRSNNSGGLVRLRNGLNVGEVLFSNNTVQAPSDSPLVNLSTGGYAFSGLNRYHSAAAADRLFRIDGNPANLAAWITASGDLGASAAPIVFPDPDRDLETYMEYLGLGSGFDDFVEAVHGQSRANWNPALTAGAINDWLRGGFGMPAVGSGDRIFANGFQP